MSKVVSGLLFLFLALFPFGQLTRLPFNSPEVHVFFNDLVLGFLLFFWLIWRQKKVKLPNLGKPILIFLAWSLLSLGLNSPRLSNRETLVASLYWLRLVAYFGVYFLIFDLKKYLKWLNKTFLQNILLCLGISLAIFGLIQYFLWPDLTVLTVIERDPHLYRIVSPFLDPGFTGLIYVFTLILLITKRNKQWGWLALVYLALMLTYSRASYLAYLLAMGVIFFKQKKPKFFLIVFLIWLATILVLPRPEGEGVRLERLSTIRLRIENWQQSLEISQDHLLIGVGFNSYRYAQRDYNFLQKDWQKSLAGAGADSSLLFVLATTGIIGLSIYLWFYYQILRTKNLVIFTTSLVLLVHACFLNSLFYPWILVWWGITLALQ